MKVEIRAERAPFEARIELLVRAGNDVGTNITMQEHDGASKTLPTVSIRFAEAQLLMDDLWRAGIRPSEGEGSAGQLRATQEHLKDLRSVAFHALKMEK